MISSNNQQPLQFDSATVLANYNLIQFGRSKEEKSAANHYIVSFIESDQVWSISLELLGRTSGPNN